MLGVLLALSGFAALPAALADCPKLSLNLSAAGLHQLVQDEGGFKYYRFVMLADGTRAKRWVPYNDSKSYCTVGHGHLIAYEKCTPELTKKWTLTNAQAEALLLHDAQSRVRTVNHLVTRGLTQSQFDALVNFVYNAGAGHRAYRDKKGVLHKATGLIGQGILAAVNKGDFPLAGRLILRYISKQERKSSPGLIPRRDLEAAPFLHSSPGDCPPAGKTPPPTKPPPPPTQSGPPDCSNDDLDELPPAGCDRVEVRIIPSYLPSDPKNETVGQGVGTATIEPGGETLPCLNPANAGACVRYVDVTAGTAVSVTEQPGSIQGDAASPPDSAFYKFDGACSGNGACTFTPTSSSSVVDVYFIPAMATLTLKEDGGGDQVNMTAQGVVGNAGDGFGTEPAGPVYCGGSSGSDPLPCSLQVRLDNSAQVEADTGGDESIKLDSFSENCTPAQSQPDDCDVVMSGNETVTATFGES